MAPNSFAGEEATSRIDAKFGPNDVRTAVVVLRRFARYLELRGVGKTAACDEKTADGPSDGASTVLT
ncbi:hypothetical protein LOC67_13300 [Stieleria sp. JC731]|uniref:hypothetical protein n=1 Tax=Pirellulaceae TaxID=2691357 RepID=UPI001E5EEFD9|nr:hypothetical protein [Stieleria sp. JC731]MCC9601527.1 hypothetical protein [Stieleria sp. JC731]